MLRPQVAVGLSSGFVPFCSNAKREREREREREKWNDNQRNATVHESQHSSSRSFNNAASALVNGLCRVGRQCSHASQGKSREVSRLWTIAVPDDDGCRCRRCWRCRLISLTVFLRPRLLPSSCSSSRHYSSVATIKDSVEAMPWRLN